jgi:hypothetical protein
MLHFLGNNGDMKGPQCYIKRTLSSYVLRLDRGTRRVETELRLHKGKGKAWTGPEGSRRLRLPDFKTIGT